MRIALTRAVPPSIVRCELTHLARAPIDLDRARDEHAAYEAALAALGCAVRRIAPAPELPDSVFVEDAALVLDEVAVLTRPGAASRRAEVASVAAALGEYRPLLRIEPPGTLDGGDVLRSGRRVWVGRTPRSNAAGCQQLRALLAPHGYDVRAVAVQGCLHLKTAVTEVADDTLLLNPEWVDRATFGAYALLEVDPGEPFAANVLRVGDAVLCAAAHPRTRERLSAAGVETHGVEVGELAKAEAGLTCCSLIFTA